ncbi:hypothetical protein HYU93_00485 [Candidatus Daviesbacteria bacterium]|nr:hypothetical protein [Candidatus Daviesbacteria bacterium]
MKKFLSFVVFLFSLVVFAPKAYAASEFATSYDVLYDVGEDGITSVTEKINLRNLTSEYYANQFKLNIDATQIYDIKAQDPSGPLIVASQQNDTLTSLNIKFNQQVAGIGKSLPWTLSFKSKDFAQNLGKVWEVRVPKVSSASTLESYNLILTVPQSFGEPSLISPTPRSQSTFGGKTFLTFDKDQLKSTGVSVTFGANQLFDFDLSYHLENNNLIPALTNIALPPDTAYQDVIYQRIEPKPLNVTLDDDGNYLAWYKLQRNQKLDVKVIGSAKLYAYSKVKNPTLNGDLRKKYTSSNKYWEKDNPQIILKLKEIFEEKNPTDTYAKAQLIYQYVVESLKYDPSRLKEDIERLGAVTVLNNPQSAVCMEFTDLFIALARAAGIPSRELNGYAYTSNPKLKPLSLSKDLLHSWPEYFDEKKGWVMIDPTWSNTTGGVDYFNKLDLNHFVFAVHGFSSLEPIPAGSYKYTNQNSSDIKVNLSNQDFLGHPQVDVQIDTAGPVFSGFPGIIRVQVTNTGNSFYPSSSLNLLASKLNILSGEGRFSGVIPAYGTAKFDFNIRTASMLDLYEDQLTLLIGDQKFTKDIVIKPFVSFQSAPFLTGVGIVLMVLIYSTVLGAHVYHKRIRKPKN